MSHESPLSPDTLICPNCQKEVVYYDSTGSWFYGCPHCNQYFEYENEGPAQKIRQFPKATASPILPIGVEGYLANQWLRVVGYIHRKEANAPYQWGEYVLLNRSGVYSMLAEYDGHWTLIQKDAGVYSEFWKKGKAYYVDTPARQYRLFNRYKPETLFAVGEFDWDILTDDKLTVSEYIHPPYSLTHEAGPNQSDWYVGEYLDQESIATAFGLSSAELPARTGIGASQPAPTERIWKPLWQTTIFFLIALFVVQILFLVFKSGHTLHSKTYTTATDTSRQAEQNSFKPIVTSSFDVDGPAMLEITLSSPLRNQWVELPVSLVNEETGLSYSFTKVLEYYYGVESGESWSEGKREDVAVLSRIPSGRYHINLYPFAEKTPVLDVAVGVKKKNPISNLFVIAGLLLIYPILQYFRRQWFEYSRWTNSDYSDIEE